MAESVLKLTPAEEKLILALRNMPADAQWFHDFGSMVVGEGATADEDNEPTCWGTVLCFAFEALGEERKEINPWRSQG